MARHLLIAINAFFFAFNALLAITSGNMGSAIVAALNLTAVIVLIPVSSK